MTTLTDEKVAGKIAVGDARRCLVASPAPRTCLVSMNGCGEDTGLRSGPEWEGKGFRGYFHSGPGLT